MLLNRPTHHDMLLTSALVNAYPALSGMQIELRAAYERYLEVMTCWMQPIAMSNAAKAAFNTAYASKAKKARMDWISSILGHGLLFCPLCGGLGAATIDHHLPQDTHPEFSVFSANLLPSCSTCNSKRKASNGYKANSQTLHPYFDHRLLSKPLIIMKVTPPFEAAIFDLDVLPGLDPPDEVRVREHIRISVSNSVLNSVGKGILSDIRTWRQAHSGDCAILDDELSWRLNKDAAAFRFNSWNIALYRYIISDAGLKNWIVAHPL